MKQLKSLAVMTFALCMVFALAGCGGKPTSDDAVQYVQAVLDGICTGEYDHSVKFADVEENDFSKIRDDVVEEMVSALTEDEGLDIDEEVEQSIRDMMLKAFSKCKYHVDGAEKADDGYDVTVTIEPLKLVKGDMDSLMDGAMTDLMSDPDLLTMSEDEMVNRVLRYMMDAVTENLDDPDYDDPVEVTVRYEELEDNLYGVSEEDGGRLGEKMFAAMD